VCVWYWYSFLLSACLPTLAIAFNSSLLFNFRWRVAPSSAHRRQSQQQQLQQQEQQQRQQALSVIVAAGNTLQANHKLWGQPTTTQASATKKRWEGVTLPKSNTICSFHLDKEVLCMLVPICFPRHKL